MSDDYFTKCGYYTPPAKVCKQQVYNWIKDVINSTQNMEQCITCEYLIDNFKKMYKDEILTKELFTSLNNMTNFKIYIKT